MIADISPAFKVEYIVRALDRCAADQLYISVNDHGLDSWTFTMDSKALYERDSILLTLSKNRVVVDPRYRDCINDYLYEQYRVCKANHKIKLTHHNLGWAVIGEKEIFLRDQNSVNNSVSQSDRAGFRFRSGDEKVYKDFLRNTVYPVPTLALAMTLGYAAPVISRLQDKVPDLRTVIVNLCGASSTGKTTALNSKDKFRI